MRHLRTFAALLAVVAAAFFLPAANTLAGEIYLDPVGGWTYLYDGDAVAPGTGGFTALDNSWSHDNGSDEWDGTGIGAGRPGGASAMTAGPSIPGLDWLRIQDTGDPRDHGMGDPGSNRKLMFAHDATADVGNNPLDAGVTLTFRARLATTPPLDDTHPDGGGAPSAWSVDGDGYLIHDGGKGIGMKQASGGGIGFHLARQADGVSASGLAMNSLNGTSVSADVDSGEGTENLLPLVPTDWHEFWIQIESGGAGTHQVSVYKDGSLTPDVFDVTAGNGSDYSDISYLIMETGATGQSGAVDIDFIAYKGGLHDPVVPEPSTMIMLAAASLLGLFCWRRRR